MSDFYTKLVANGLFPLHERLKRHDSVKRRETLEQSQWWSPEEIATAQVDRLRSFLGFVGEQVPYYRDLFASLRFRPDALEGVEDLAALPLLDKATIRQNVEALRRPGASGLSRFNTGGSSGEPLVFYLDQERVSHDVAAKWRATRWWGVDIGDPEVVVWGSPIELGAQDRVKLMRDRLLRTTLLPAFEMSPERLDAFITQLRTLRPRMLFGYPSALSHIARHAAERGVRLDDLGVRVVFCTSERLYDHQRADIESAFACRVANGYGSRDAGFIAHECSHGGMHVSAEDIVVEIVDARGNRLPPGQLGEIVVTHMATSSFPFVRYRTGDMAVLDDARCACGRGLPMLRSIEGRSTDFIVARDGTVMHGLALIYIVRDMPEVSAFRIVQESLTLTRVEVVPGAGFDDAIRDRIRNGFAARLGEGVSIELVEMGEIPAERSGKYRYVISRVPAHASAGSMDRKEPACVT